MKKRKFRAWDGKKFVPVYQMQFQESGIVARNKKLIRLDDVKEFIGIRDKNNVDIYEEDVVIFNNFEVGGEKVIGTVEWNDDPTLDNIGWGLWVQNKGWRSCDFLGTLEIIGNARNIEDEVIE